MFGHIGRKNVHETYSLRNFSEVLHIYRKIETLLHTHNIHVISDSNEKNNNKQRHVHDSKSKHIHGVKALQPYRNTSERLVHCQIPTGANPTVTHQAFRELNNTDSVRS